MRVVLKNSLIFFFQFFQDKFDEIGAEVFHRCCKQQSEEFLFFPLVEIGLTYRIIRQKGALEDGLLEPKLRICRISPDVQSIEKEEKTYIAVLLFIILCRISFPNSSKSSKISISNATVITPRKNANKKLEKVGR